MNYKKALEGIVQRRKEQLAMASEVYNAAIKTNPRLYEIELTLRRFNLMEIYGEKLASKPSGEHNLHKEIARLESEKQRILVSLGITSELLNPRPACDKCMDLGIFEGRFCDCVKRAAIIDDENIGLPVRRFEDSDKAIQQKNGLGALYEHMHIFCEKFPFTNIKNIVLLGSSGTGKTYLASCIAGELLIRGFSVVFLTAFGALQKMLAYHTSFAANKNDQLLPLLDCDVLIIDDLGTESILKNVTLEYLYIVINERMLKGRHTIITSNLDMQSMTIRYGEKITSRLFDKRTCLSKVLEGTDLRKN